MSDDHQRSVLYSPSNEHPPVLPQWAPRHARSRSNSSNGPLSFTTKFLAKVQKFRRSVRKQIKKLSLIQQIGLGIVVAITVVIAILMLLFHEKLFHALVPLAVKWRNLRGGWLIIFFWCFFSAFPPVIGYSSCVTVAGFVYGFPNGWFIVAAGTVIGSTTAFMTCRLYFKAFTQRLIAHDKRFAALALTLKHDGLKLLCMIRLCPLPYSIGNGAMSTFPTVSPWSFATATALATPKLLIQVFIGSRMALLGERGEKMDAKTKAINYASIVIGVILGAGTGYIIYSRTVKRAQQLEAEERAHARAGSPVETNVREMFTDDPDEVDLTAERTLSRESSADNGDENEPRQQNTRFGKQALGVLGGIFGRKEREGRGENDSSDSEEDAGRLLDGDEDEGDEDAEELLVVDRNTLELEESGRKSQDSKGKKNSNESARDLLR